MAPDSINTIGGDITVNGRTYRLPRQPVVVVCIDGSEPGYIEGAVEAGIRQVASGTGREVLGRLEDLFWFHDARGQRGHYTKMSLTRGCV